MYIPSYIDTCIKIVMCIIQYGQHLFVGNNKLQFLGFLYKDNKIHFILILIYFYTYIDPFYNYSRIRRRSWLC